ncbi:MAG: c-type cytochrome domain-containing protein [Planctomycetaceae bacterium]
MSTARKPRRRWARLGLGTALLACAVAATLAAELSVEHQRQLDESRKSLGKVQTLVARRQWDEASQMLDDVERRIRQVAQAAQVGENDKLIAGLLRQVERKRAALPRRPREGQGAASSTEGPATANPSAKSGRSDAGGRVSFVRDVAPFVVNLCLRCHSGKEPRGGLSVETFEKLMRGGDSGSVVTAGSLENSRLWQLVGEQDPIKMPPAPALITRKNHSDLRTWIEQGARFDGPDAKALLRTIVPSDEQRHASELAALSPDELVARCQTRAHDFWRAAFPAQNAIERERADLLLLGNVAESRLEELAGWAEDQIQALQSLFRAAETPVWPGRLTVFIFADRFGYSEFMQTNENRDPPPGLTGHLHNGRGPDDRYLCFADAGETPDERSPGARARLSALVTEAFLQRGSHRLPGWAARGLGLSQASQRDPQNGYWKELRSTAANVVRDLDRPVDAFEDRGFSPREAAAVSYTLVAHLQQTGGEPRLVSFYKELAVGKRFETALQAAYGTTPESLAQAYAAGFASAKAFPKPAAKARR